MGLNQSIHSDPIADYMATDRLFHDLRGRREMAEVIAEEKGMFLSDMHRSSFEHKEAQLQREKKLKMELQLARARIEELQNLLSSKKHLPKLTKDVGEALNQDSPPSYQTVMSTPPEYSSINK